MQDRVHAEEQPAPATVREAPARETAASPLLALQRAAGNAATVAALGVQAKLKVGAVDDPAEREADAVADHVLRHLDAGESDEVEVEDEDALQRQPRPLARMIRRRRSDELAGEPGHGLEGGDAAPEVAGRIERSRGGGRPMDDATLSRMESAFGADMSGVRIHADAEAADLSRSLNAKAFTAGNDVYFGAGEYDPSSGGGAATLAHELAHTVQQTGAKQLSQRRWKTAPL